MPQPRCLRYRCDRTDPPPPTSPSAGLTLLVPHVPGITLDYFAARRAGHTLHCDALPRDMAQPDAAACRVRWRRLLVG
jgi:hypothetical protein